MGFLRELFNLGKSQNVTSLISILIHSENIQEKQAAAKAILKIRDSQGIELQDLLQAVKNENYKFRDTREVTELSSQEKERIQRLGGELLILPSNEARVILTALVKLGIDTYLVKKY